MSSKLVSSKTYFSTWSVKSNQTLLNNSIRCAKLHNVWKMNTNENLITTIIFFIGLSTEEWKFTRKTTVGKDVKVSWNVASGFLECIARVWFGVSTTSFWGSRSLPEELTESLMALSKRGLQFRRWLKLWCRSSCFAFEETRCFHPQIEGYLLSNSWSKREPKI